MNSAVSFSRNIVQFCERLCQFWEHILKVVRREKDVLSIEASQICHIRSSPQQRIISGKSQTFDQAIAAYGPTFGVMTSALAQIWLAQRRLPLAP